MCIYFAFFLSKLGAKRKNERNRHVVSVGPTGRENFCPYPNRNPGLRLGYGQKFASAKETGMTERER
jgi:hypothetical protein